MMRDLVVLVADKDARYGLQGFLARHHLPSIRPVNLEPSDIIVYNQHDSGVIRDATTLLRPFLSSHRYALVCFDLEGCGKCGEAANLERQVEEDLSRNGWQQRSISVIFEPELERWLWNGSAAFAKYLKLDTYALLQKSLEQNFVFDHAGKPIRPKEAFRAALRNAKMPLSSSLYEELGRSLSASRCQERSFLKLIATLQVWFPI